MSLAFDTQSLMPWSESDGVYTSTRPNSADATALVASYCRYSGMRGEAVPSDGVYLHEDETVTFASNALPWEPKPQDTFTPSGDTPRVVIAVNDNRFLKYWKLTVRNLILSYDLQQSAIIYRPNVTASVSGLRLANLAVLRAATPCRLQPITMSAAAGRFAGKLLTRLAFDCYLGVPIRLLAGDVIEVESVKYEVTEQSEIDRLDTLTTVRCERIS